MNRPSSLVLVSTTLAVFVAVAAVDAQLNTASAIRGQVLDPQGQPIADVKVELEFKGESRVKILKKTSTNKKGGYIYSGLLPGDWAFHFTKPGFKTTVFNTSISLGGLSDIPPITMQPGTDTSVATAIGAAAAPDPGPAAATPTGPDAKVLADKYTKAMAAMKAGQAAEAETLMNEIVATVPAFAPAHQALASVYVTKGDMAAAEASYRRVVELDAAAAVSHLALANFLATQNRYDEAFKVLQVAAPQFPQDAIFQFALGAAAFNLGKSEDAQAAFLKAAELDAANPEPHFYLGSLAVSRSEVPKAIEHFERYVSLAAPTAPNLAAAKGLLESLKKKK